MIGGERGGVHRLALVWFRRNMRVYFPSYIEVLLLDIFREKGGQRFNS